MTLSWGPLNGYKSWNKCFVNGHKFHTNQWASRQRTDNSGICVKGEVATDGTITDWYGVIKEIVQVQYVYCDHPAVSVTLFSCDWFDPSSGTRYDSEYNVTEVNQSRRYSGYDPFIVAQNAKQVYYANYPGQASGWKAVIKTKPSSRIELDDDIGSAYQVNEAIPPKRVQIFSAHATVTVYMVDF